jgi:hypothetical protein
MKSQIPPRHDLVTVMLALAVQFIWLMGNGTGLNAAQPSDEAAREKWVLRTDDTELVLGVSADQKLCIYQFSGPDGWNWTEVPSVLPLLDRVEVAGARINPAWTYREGTVDAKDGVTLTIVFTCANPALELRTVWQTHEGPGPVHLSMFIVNKSDKAVTIHKQESLDIRVSGPGENTSVRYINDDGAMPDQVGVYRDSLAEGYRKELRFSEDQDYIPLMVMESGGAHGVYFGWEWSIGRMAISADDAAGGARITAGNGDSFKTDLAPGEVFEVPPAFLGAYHGDLDDAANSLHHYWFNRSMPALLRQDASYPRVEWNAFAATALEQGSWYSTETKYYPLIDDLAALGFEDIVLDVNWWDGDTNRRSHPPVGHPTRWPTGILAARDDAHKKGMHFGLYWNCNSSMTARDGMQHRKDDAKYLYDQFKIDYYRTDGTDGNVLQTGAAGPGSRAHYAEDVGYWQTKGFYEVIDWLYANVPNFAYENCSGGGRIKDFGIMKRAVRIQAQDVYRPVDARRAFWDSSYALHPMQISALSGTWADWQASGSVYEFRSASVGAPYWHPDAPNGGNGGPKWSDAQKLEIRRAVETYKTKIRPLVRTANLYHVLPRPDDKRWDGIEYFDPVSKRGAVYIFRPDNPESRQVVQMKGLNSKAKYWLWGEDSSVTLQQASGDELMQRGLPITLPEAFTSDIVFVQDASLGKPEGLLEPADFKLRLAKSASEPFAITAELAWEPSTNARSYRVSVSDTADFANTVAKGTTATPSIVLSRLPAARTLYWKVEAVSPAGTRRNTGGPGTFVTPESHCKGVTFASDMPWTKATAGAETVHRDTTFSGKPLTIDGKRYAKGLWTHAFNDQTPADTVFDIAGKNYATFKATVGVDDRGERGSVQFQLLVDGVKKAESPVMLPRKTHAMSVDVGQAKEVTLRVLNGGDGYTCDHAVWGFARFAEAGMNDTFEQGP